MLCVLSGAIYAQSPITFQYFYDDLNQLTKVVDSTGVVIQYVYDSVGNILQINRSTVAPGALTIFNITPSIVGTGSTLTIQGQGFSTITSQDSVTINGLAATVLSATAASLVVLVPENATSGIVAVTVGGMTVSRSAPITVIPLPVITSVTPKTVLAGTTGTTFTVNGANLVGSTFAFYGTSNLVNVSGWSISASGTSATMTLTVNSSASGRFPLIATNAAGPSDSTQHLGFLPGTSFNTLTIPGSNPNADPDEDGLTNAQEIALATDPLNDDTDGDGYPDGMEVFYGTDPLNPLSFPSATALSPTYAITAPFSILNTTSPSSGPETYSISGLPFSIQNTTAPGPGPQTYSISGLPYSILNTVSPAPTPQTYLITWLTFSIFNGTMPFIRPVPAAPSLTFRVPVDPAFIAEALARGRQRVDGKPVCLDSDGDGLCDSDELILGTNPYLADSDGDGYPDGLELLLGSDPLDPKSIPDIRPPGYIVTPPVSIQNTTSSARLTPRRQGAINAKNDH